MTLRLDVRAASVADESDILRLALANAMFEPDELGGMIEMLHGYFDGSLDGHRWIVAEAHGGSTTGAAYYAPEPFSDRLWNLYFIAVDPNSHRSGIGRHLLEHVESALRTAGESVARILIVETSSTDSYDGARRFYRARGYDEEARIRGFYGPGDDKVVFWKSLAAA